VGPIRWLMVARWLMRYEADGCAGAGEAMKIDVISAVTDNTTHFRNVTLCGREYSGSISTLLKAQRVQWRYNGESALVVSRCAHVALANRHRPRQDVPLPASMDTPERSPAQASSCF
jgi:hypothetical protein